jgi:segregation and condensation protein A
MQLASLDLDLEVFQGPFDLLLALVLREEVDLLEVDLAEVVLTYIDYLEQAGELDLEAATEFLVLIAALLELKARGLFPDEAAELAELEPEEAAEELARRLAEYRRAKESAAWLRERLSAEGDRYFRLGPAPLAPKVETPLAPQDPGLLARALSVLAQDPPEVSLSHMALRFPPVSQFLERFRALLRRRSRFDFDTEVGEMTRLEQASAFLAVLELGRAGELSIEQAAPFAPIRVSRLAQENNARDERTAAWTVRSA